MPTLNVIGGSNLKKIEIVIFIFLIYRFLSFCFKLYLLLLFFIIIYYIDCWNSYFYFYIYDLAFDQILGGHSKLSIQVFSM